MIRALIHTFSAPHSESLARSRLALAGALVYLAGMTALLLALFPQWVYDDPYIIFRYAQNLIGGNGFVFNPGEQVLSTTTVLFPLLLAGGGMLLPNPDLQLPFLANLIGALSLAGGGLLLFDLARRAGQPTAAWTVLLLYPTFPSLVNSLSSEMPLYIFLCLAALSAYTRQQTRWAAAGAALAVLARPDGILIALLLAGYHLMWKRRRIDWTAAAVFAALTLPWVVFAWAYYGSPVPVTLAAKQFQGAMPISQRFLPGLWALVRTNLRAPYFVLETGLALLGLVGYLMMEIKARRAASAQAATAAPEGYRLVFLWLAGYTLGYTLLGVSRYFWYYAPLAAGWTAAVGLGAAALTQYAIRFRLPVPQRYLLGLTLGVLFVVVLVGQLGGLLRVADRVIDQRIPVYRQIGVWLQTNTPPEARIGTLEVGAIGYYSQRTLIDFAGLIQPAVAPVLAETGSYESAAQWAIEQFRPEYLVLHDQVFPALEAGYVARRCRRVHTIPADPEAYDRSMSIYACAGN